MRTSTVAHSAEEVARLLKKRLPVVTDNRSALIELGFVPAYPQCTSGCESTVWERLVDCGYRETERGIRRVVAREQAYLATLN
jgi:hypothetical protein